MRKIIGIGETIMDIIFKDGQPTAAVPGGSVFNGIISLGRLGQNVTIISETGNDRVGNLILEFMRSNGVSTDNVNVYHDSRSAISLAWLNERNDAEYSFYKDYPKARLDIAEWPEINKDDIVMMGSYFVLNPILRPKVKEFLEYARSHGALIYYDLNFRSTHRAEAIKLYADILENLEYADIVRGSTEDLENMFGISDADKVYKKEIDFYCKNMLCTDAGGDIRLITPAVSKSYSVEKIETVSTIGAGDNFNAGIIYGLIKENVGRDDIASITAAKWDRIVSYGCAFAAEVCRSFHNSISPEFAKEFLLGK
ncbi:MAG: carbohydrate kinase [Bacteroides sp.]|nr:carbohydrate kinase [Roseburia sp.]MCM1347335.1 carbohydrate kinase [Bacteroides sp.]MCM1421815.1 carbohydrate kinase [Bacteroides sp.]